MRRRIPVALRLANFLAILRHARRGIAGVYDQPGVGDDKVVVVRRMVGRDQYAILRGQYFGR
jgi:hypothetical protein